MGVGKERGMSDMFNKCAYKISICDLCVNMCIVCIVCICVFVCKYVCIVCIVCVCGVMLRCCSLIPQHISADVISRVQANEMNPFYTFTFDAKYVCVMCGCVCHIYVDVWMCVSCVDVCVICVDVCVICVDVDAKMYVCWCVLCDGALCVGVLLCVV